MLLSGGSGAVLAQDEYPNPWVSVDYVRDNADAILAALVMSAASLVLQVVLGTNDDDEYALRVTRRIARRQGAGEPTDVPGIVFLEIDGLALPVLRDAMRDGSAPEMASWISDHGYQMVEWEPDLSSQTGASQAGIDHGGDAGCDRRHPRLPHRSAGAEHP